MRQISIITIHSEIDLITNSSTELFICNTNKSLEIVKEILESNKNLSGYQEPWVFNLDKYREWRKKYRNISSRTYDELS